MSPLSRWSLPLFIGALVFGLGGFATSVQATENTTCCLCQRTDAGNVAARGYFNIESPATCANALTSPLILGTHQASEVTAISCTNPGASCPGALPSAQLLSTLLPAAATPAPLPNVTTPAHPPVAAVIPVLGIQIPGLQFGGLTEEDRTTQVPFLAQYIAAVYRYATGIAGLVATIVMVYAGFLYLLGSATNDVKKAKEMMVNAVAGLLLMIGGYAILSNINDNVLDLGPLNISTIDQVTVLEDEVDFAPPAQVAALPPAAAVNSGGRANRPAPQPFIRTPANDCMASMQVHPVYQPILQQASQLFCQRRPAGSNWRIVGGGARSPTTQLRMWTTRCWGKAQCDDAMTCSPLSAADRHLADSLLGPSHSVGNITVANTRPSAAARGAAYQIFLPHIDPLNCPHVSGLAVDISCNISGGEFRPNVPCQLILEHAMHDAGACRLRQETWHFEPNQYRVSGSSCLFDESWIGRVQKPGSTTVSTYSSCPIRWRYDNERCSDT